MSSKSRKIFLTVLTTGIVIAGAAILISCGSSSNSGSSGSGGDNWSPSPTTAAITLPAFVYDPTAPKDTVKAYRFALERPDLLSQVPCYCGCGGEANHKNNLDCFVKTRNGDNVTFDSHGAG